MHAWKIFTTNTYYNNWKWERWTSNYFWNCLFHIVNDSICQQKENIILLIILWYVFTFSKVYSHFYYLTKIGRSVEINIHNCISICFYYSFNSIAFRIKNVSINCKTMSSSVIYRWYLCSKTKSWNILVRIIILKNWSNWLDCLNIFILIWIEEVQWLGIVWVTIR